MNETFRCGDGAALVAYLYDECTPDERDVIAAHAAVCVRCAEELAGLGGTRRQLGMWAPPEARLGFRVTAADADTVVDARAAFGAPADGPPPAGRQNPRWWQRPLPAWAQAAAALLIFGAGISLGSGGRAAAPAVPDGQDQRATVALQQDVKALQERIAGVEQIAAKGGQALDEATLDRRVEAAFRQFASSERQWVRAQLADSEDRQRQELAVRTIQLVADMQGERRSDQERVRRLSQDQEELSRRVWRVSEAGGVPAFGGRVR